MKVVEITAPEKLSTPHSLLTPHTGKYTLFKKFQLALGGNGGNSNFNIDDERISTDLINLETLIISLSYVWKDGESCLMISH